MNRMKINYEEKMNEIIKEISSKKEVEREKKFSLLLHSCCAPCSSAVIEYLQQYFQITIFFYNPNITDSKEYYMRKEEQERYIERYTDIKLVTTEYNSKKDFFDIIKGYENCEEGEERCRLCYEKRLEETSKYAKENKFSYFGTVLSISPLKNVDWINSIGERLERRDGVNFLFSDFKKKGRYQKSIEISKIENLYRQDYCGCIFSKESSKKRREMKENGLSREL